MFGPSPIVVVIEINRNKPVADSQKSVDDALHKIELGHQQYGSLPPVILRTDSHACPACRYTNKRVDSVNNHIMTRHKARGVQDLPKFLFVFVKVNGRYVPEAMAKECLRDIDREGCLDKYIKPVDVSDSEHDIVTQMIDFHLSDDMVEQGSAAAFARLESHTNEVDHTRDALTTKHHSTLHEHTPEEGPECQEGPVETSAPVLSTKDTANPVHPSADEVDILPSPPPSRAPSPSASAMYTSYFDGAPPTITEFWKRMQEVLPENPGWLLSVDWDGFETEYKTHHTSNLTDTKFWELLEPYRQRYSRKESHRKERPLT
ncbi:hypothetical protein CALCODRAFT_504405 [Calocera cornea HHB12733]|uniref:Uncharacterized protein n=1 Tax=Calocera cornea HHB12733 TaxID=1353952 RepID=A0A165CG68_9BASI|nr:hypothetical protein CALCODRAFT_504405 [Calocera cornea HHB12733]